MSDDFDIGLDVAETIDVDNTSFDIDSPEITIDSVSNELPEISDSVALDTEPSNDLLSENDSIEMLEIDNGFNPNDESIETLEIDDDASIEMLETDDMNIDNLDIDDESSIDTLENDDVSIESLEFNEDAPIDTLSTDDASFETSDLDSEDSVETVETDDISTDTIEQTEDVVDFDSIPGNLDEAYDEVLDDSDTSALPEREYDEFETAQMLENPEFYETGQFYEQGINEYGFEGTCGPTSQANAINTLLGNNDLTENKVLDIAVDNNLCEITDIPENSGGTTTENFMELYDKVNESIGDKIDVDLYDYDNALSVDEMAQRIEDGSVLNVAVDSATLWGENNHIPGTLFEDTYTDHWITVTGVSRDSLGNIESFDVIDSGGGVDKVDPETYERMCFGEDGREMLDPTCIVVSKKDV